MKTVLIVDDEVDFCMLLEKSLRKDGFRVETANTLAEAHVKLKACFDIVFLDHNLPDGTGLEFFTKNRHKFGSSCIVMISADSSLETQQHAENAGVAAFIQKPFTVDFVKKKIEELA